MQTSLAAGRERATTPAASFDVAATVPVSFGDDLDACAEPIRGYAALYVGGMGSREQNFYNQLACRMGYEQEAGRVQDLYLEGQHREAMAAVPLRVHRPDLPDRTAATGGRAVARLRGGRCHHAHGHDLRSRPPGKNRRPEAGRCRPGRQRSRRLTDVDLIDALILGIVEGLTEFLPVSSTGHLTITEKLLGLRIDDPAVTAFTVVIQMGAILAVIVYFRRDIWNITRAWVSGIVKPEVRGTFDYRMGWYVIAGSVPIVVAGLLGESLITGALRNLWWVAGALIVWSGVMVLAERVGRQQRTEQDLTLRDSVLIGVVQVVALVPGVSRSGATISAGLFAGLDRVTATRMSFFLAIPALMGAGLKELPTALGGDISVATTVVATIVSFVVAYASVAWLLKFVAGHSITWFVGYRVVVGAVLLVLLGTGVITAT
ncbi:MAG: undecaprenyl-diphosphate phosphatase [Nocardioidaceae bacterium]